MDYYKYYVICVVALAGEWTLVGGVLNVTIVSFGFPGGAEFISSAYSAPAMDVAVQDAMRLYNRTLNMEITYLDNRGMRDCNGVTALSEPLLAEWYYKQRISGNVNALIVPGCVTDNTIGHLVSNWDMLLITTASSNGNAQDVIKRPTWITTAFISTGAYIEVYLDLLHMFQWRSVMVITDRDSPPVYGAVARKVIAGISGILGYSVSQKEIFTRDNATMLRFPTLLRDFSRISRVMLIFGRGPVVRNLLISAGKLNMTNGEYVYVAMEPFRNRLYGRMDWQYNDTDDPMAREAFRSLLLVQPADSLIPQPEKNRRFSVQVLNRSETAYNNSYQLKDQPFPIIAAGYSAVMALAQVLNNLVVGLPGFDFSKGALIAQEFLGRSFPTRAEDVYFNEAGERRTDMVVSYCNGSESFTPILIKRKAEDHLLAINNVTWPNGVWPPPNEPKCGYFGQKCVSLEAQTAFWNTVKGVGFGVFGAIAVIFTVVLYRMRRNLQEKMLKDVWWRIDNSQMTLVPASTLRSTRRRALMSQSLNQRPVAAADDTKALAKNSFPAQYKGALVQLTVIAAIQDYSDVSQAFTSTALLALLKKLRGISHYNVCTFMGITVLPQTMKYAIVAEYAERGSVYELFESCLPMESNFIMSFVVELSQGLSYIHSSSLMYHGNLSSTTCLIDKHFTLKISELAYDKIIHIFSGERSASRKKPENRADAIGKQKADILAEATVIYEIFSQRNLPLSKRRVSFLQELISTSDNADGLLRRFRPLLKSCYDHDPLNRPTARKIQMEVVKWSNYLYGGNGNLAEKILWRLSQHSEDLEEEVLRRTTNLLDERAKCDAILARFLPSSVVRQLRSGSNVIPEMFELVTLMFTDMPDFGAYVARHPPLRATTVLAELDMLFHALLSQYAVYRVENISDSYMIASGVPVANGTQNVLEICSLAQAVMRRAPEKLSVYQELPIKVGIHSGPLAAGVIGTKKPKYCLFGNTVNIASRMCSHGISGRIQLSDSTADVARTVYPQLMLEERGWIAVKGAGEMQTFWLQF